LAPSRPSRRKRGRLEILESASRISHLGEGTTKKKGGPEGEGKGKKKRQERPPKRRVRTTTVHTFSEEGRARKKRGFCCQNRGKGVRTNHTGEEKGTPDVDTNRKNRKKKAFEQLRGGEKR